MRVGTQVLPGEGQESLLQREHFSDFSGSAPTQEERLGGQAHTMKGGTPLDPPTVIFGEGGEEEVGRGWAPGTQVQDSLELLGESHRGGPRLCFGNLEGIGGQEWSRLGERRAVITQHPLLTLSSGKKSRHVEKQPFLPLHQVATEGPCTPFFLCFFLVPSLPCSLLSHSFLSFAHEKGCHLKAASVCTFFPIKNKS